MHPDSTLAQLADDMLLIPDAQERLAALCSWGRAAPELPAAECSDALLVPGCQSRVHLAAEAVNGRFFCRIAADSAMVRGLAGVTVRLANGTAPEDAAAASYDWPIRLGLDRILSGTRIHGLAAVAARIRILAAG